MIKITLLLTSIILYGSINKNIENKAWCVKQAQNCDSITKKDFLFKIIKGIEFMNFSDSLTDDQAIHIIKTYNSFKLAAIIDNMHKDTCIINYYSKAFEERFLKNTNSWKQLHLTISKGFTLYSTKYDLYVGSGAFRCKDYYLVKQ